MKFSLTSVFKRKPKKLIKDYKQEILNREGAKQFKKMIDRGIELPVVPL